MTHDSQRIRILRWLAAGNTLTTWQAIKKWGCTTASQRRTELIAQGWPIVSRMIQVGRKRVAEYSIPAAKAALVRKSLEAL